MNFKLGRNVSVLGLVGVGFTMDNCESVSVYGLQPDGYCEQPSNPLVPYHYYEHVSKIDFDGLEQRRGDSCAYQRFHSNEHSKVATRPHFFQIERNIYNLLQDKKMLRIIVGTSKENNHS